MGVPNAAQMVTAVWRCTALWTLARTSSPFLHVSSLSPHRVEAPPQVRILHFCASVSPKVSFSSSSCIESRVGAHTSAVKSDTEEENEENGDDGEYGEYCASHQCHTPVLLSEVVTAFRDVQLHTFLDCTLGAAGHASAIIKNHHELRTFVGLDVDPKAHSEASHKLHDAIVHRGSDSPVKLHIYESNFRNLKGSLELLGLANVQVNGILMDLGMSSMQLDSPERGFSLQHDGPLDMRMDPLSILTASDILNSWSETEIGRILREYGEERHWKRIARKISEAQLLGGLHTTSQLLQLIQKSLPVKFSAGRAGWKKTAVRVFQALRIAVNDELGALERALPDAFECLSPKGRLAVISFHSLEDRIVKQFFLKAKGETVDRKSRYAKESRYVSFGHGNDMPQEEVRLGDKVLEGTHAVVLTRKPVTASENEVKHNSRSRSAKLRVLEKK